MLEEEAAQAASLARAEEEARAEQAEAEAEAVEARRRGLLAEAPPAAAAEDGDAVQIGSTLDLAAAIATSETPSASGAQVTSAHDDLRWRWEGLRQAMQAASVAWIVHTLPDISQQAAALLNTFDTEAILRHLPPPAGRPSLRSLLPASWGRTAGGQSCPVTTFTSGTPSMMPLIGVSRRLATTQLDVERALDEHYADLFPSISLCWMRLAHQVCSVGRPLDTWLPGGLPTAFRRRPADGPPHRTASWPPTTSPFGRLALRETRPSGDSPPADPPEHVTECALAAPLVPPQVGGGPRSQLDDPSGADALQLWSAQLSFVCRFAREPLSAYYAPHGLGGAAQPASARSSEKHAALKPLHDRHTNTHGATEEDIERIIGRSLRWLLSPTAVPEQLAAVLQARSHRESPASPSLLPPWPYREPPNSPPLYPGPDPNAHGRSAPHRRRCAWRTPR